MADAVEDSGRGHLARDVLGRFKDGMNAAAD
jgi:hypothetical protein